MKVGLPVVMTRYPETKNCQQPVDIVCVTNCVWLRRGRCEGLGSVAVDERFGDRNVGDVSN